MTKPTNESVAGRAYLGLRRRAMAAGRPVDEDLRLYALEGFLLRLSRSEHRDRFVLKGGVLLAAHDLRRPTTDIDVAALRVSNDAEEMRQLVVTVAATRLSDEEDDGLVFDLSDVRAEIIRDEDAYSGVRVKLLATLATARLPFHIDVNVGDPIWPAPAHISIPRLLGGDPITLNGYRLELSIAEKVVTALQRGVASTRWRDFADLYLVSRNVSFVAGELREAVRVVADHRGVAIQPLSGPLEGYGAIGQRDWVRWRGRNRLEAALPASFDEVVAAVLEFIDPVLEGVLHALAEWDPASTRWATR